MNANANPVTSSNLAGARFGRRPFSLAGFAVPGLALLGLLFPTSVPSEISMFGAEIDYSYIGAAEIAVLALLLCLFARRGGYRRISLVISATILFTIGVCTLLSPLAEFHYLAYGGPYLSLAVLLALNLEDLLPPPQFLRIVFFVINIGMITIGFTTYFATDLVHDFLLGHYSGFSPWNLAGMLRSGKPVFTFVLHSTAGFVYCLFFYLNWQTWLRRGSTLCLIFSVCYVFLEIMLQSVTSYVSVGLISLVIIYRFTPRRTFVGLLALASCLTVVGAGIEIREISAAVLETFGSEHSGYLGRYSGEGTAVFCLAYLRAHPLRPIGLGYAGELGVVGDSGPIEHMLRGSFPLVIAVYGGFWVFLRRNLHWKPSSIFVFALCVGFELGFSNLLYFRTLSLLPFVVVYLNSLERVMQGPKAATSRTGLPRLYDPGMSVMGGAFWPAQFARGAPARAISLQAEGSAHER